MTSATDLPSSRLFPWMRQEQCLTETNHVRKQIMKKIMETNNYRNDGKVMTRWYCKMWLVAYGVNSNDDSTSHILQCHLVITFPPFLWLFVSMIFFIICFLTWLLSVRHCSCLIHGNNRLEGRSVADVIIYHKIIIK